MTRSAALTCVDNSGRPKDSTGDKGAVVAFKSSQARAEQLALGYNHDVKAWRDVISTKDLSNQTLSTISDNSATEPLSGGNTEPANGQPIRFRKQRVVAARNASAVLVHVPEVAVSADPLGRAELQTLFAANCQTFTAFGAATFQDETTIFRAHAHQEPVCALAPAGIWLECALALHAFLRGPELRVCELVIVANGFQQCQSRQVRIDAPLC